MEKRSQRREGLTSCGEERNHGVKWVCEYLPKIYKTLGSWIEETALSSGSPKIVITLKDYLQNYFFPRIIPARPAGLVKHLTTAVCFTSNKAWPWKSSLGPHSGHLLSVQTFGFATAEVSRLRSAHSNSEHCFYKAGRPYGTDGGVVYDSEVNFVNQSECSSHSFF